MARPRTNISPPNVDSEIVYLWTKWFIEAYVGQREIQKDVKGHENDGWVSGLVAFLKLNRPEILPGPHGRPNKDAVQFLIGLILDYWTATTSRIPTVTKRIDSSTRIETYNDCANFVICGVGLVKQELLNDPSSESHELARELDLHALYKPIQLVIKLDKKRWPRLISGEILLVPLSST